jgi:hypothetical protein
MSLLTNQYRHVLYVYQDDLIVVTLRSDVPVSVDQYIVSPGASEEQIDGVKQRFSKFVSEHRSDEYAILVDTVDESHVVDSIPRMVYRDRIALIKKRLTQRFRGVKYSSYRVVSKGRAKWAPRFSVNETGTDAEDSNGEVFLTALTNSSALEFWVDILLSHQAKIIQLTSPALLSTELLQGFASTGSGLLVSLHPAGLRQTLIIDGAVQFSRLGSVLDFSARGLEREIVQTLQYLQSSQRVPVRFYKDGGLGVWLLASGITDLDKFSALLSVGPQWSVELEIVPENAVGADKTPVPKFAGLGSWIGALGVKRGWTDYTTEKLRQFSKRARNRRRLWFAGLGVAATGVFLTAIAPFAIQYSLPDPEKLMQREQAYQPILTGLRSQLSEYEVSSTTMRAVVERAAANEARHIPARAIFNIAADGLAGDRDIFLEQLQWRRAQDLSSGPSGLGMSGDDGGAAAAMADAMLAQDESGASPAITNAPFAPALRTQTSIEAPPAIEVTLAGRLQNVKSKTSANQRVQDIASRIKATCDCQITRIELPFDPSPVVALTENFEKSDRNKIRFTIVALWNAQTKELLQVTQK